MMNLLPLGRRVLIERKKREAVSKGGIVLPEYSQMKQLEATVIKLGAGIDPSSTILKEGDKVVVGKLQGIDLTIDGRELVMVEEENIMAKILGE